MTRHQMLGLSLMVLSAAVVAGAGWYILQAFLGMGTYIESLPL